MADVIATAIGVNRLKSFLVIFIWHLPEAIILFAKYKNPSKSKGPVPTMGWQDTGLWILDLWPLFMS